MALFYDPTLFLIWLNSPRFCWTWQFSHCLLLSLKDTLIKTDGFMYEFCTSWHFVTISMQTQSEMCNYFLPDVARLGLCAEKPAQEEKFVSGPFEIPCMSGPFFKFQWLDRHVIIRFWAALWYALSSVKAHISKAPNVTTYLKHLNTREVVYTSTCRATEA